MAQGHGPGAVQASNTEKAQASSFVNVISMLTGAPSATRPVRVMLAWSLTTGNCCPLTITSPAPAEYVKLSTTDWS